MNPFLFTQEGIFLTDYIRFYNKKIIKRAQTNVGLFSFNL